MEDTARRFVCVGTQKAGTSWLHWNLFWHPETDIIEQKEINYFWPDFDLKAARRGQVDSGHEAWHNARRAFFRALRTVNTRFNFWQYMQCVWFPRSPERYLKLLTPRRGRKVGGDICPVYSLVTSERLQEFHSALSKARRFIILRDPIDRSWSELRMKTIARNSGVFDEEQTRAFMSRGGGISFSKYSQILDTWERAGLPLDVFFYEELCENPAEFFRKICRYLGITPLVDFPHSQVRERIHVGNPLEMPDFVRSHLEQELSDEIAWCAKRFPNRWTQSWMASLSGHGKVAVEA
jgi:hypothetical protein